MADESKAKGNAAFSAGKYDEAIEHFTHAVSLAPDNHVLYRLVHCCVAEEHGTTTSLLSQNGIDEIISIWKSARICAENGSRSGLYQ